MNIVLIMPIKSRSPGVVASGRKPRLGSDGDMVCHMPIAVKTTKRLMKNIAVGSVQYIQSRVIENPLYTRPRAKPLAI